MSRRFFLNGFVLYVAQGFGLGRIPKAPGTFGTAGGLLWFLFLVNSGNAWVLLTGTLIGLLLSVWISGLAEEILQARDPGSIVIDEISAVPVLFLPGSLAHQLAEGGLPAMGDFFAGHQWVVTLVLLALFRVFDIAKPWPVRQSQRLPRGWGVTLDDLLAALYVALLSLLTLA